MESKIKFKPHPKYDLEEVSNILANMNESDKPTDPVYTPVFDRFGKTIYR